MYLTVFLKYGQLDFSKVSKTRGRMFFTKQNHNPCYSTSQPALDVFQLWEEAGFPMGKRRHQKKISNKPGGDEMRKCWNYENKIQDF